MLPHTPLIATIAVGFVSALVFGLAANRLRLPPIVGYLLAGVVVGPFTPGIVADGDMAAELAEIGVILLMFGVGLHFSYKDLLAVKNIAIPGALGQIAVATGMGMGMAWLLGWPLASGLVFGLTLSVASTVVLLRALEERQLLDSHSGHIAIGWLVVEDIVTIFALVMLPVLAELLAPDVQGAALVSAGDVVSSLALVLGKLVAFVMLMFVVGRRAILWLLSRAASTGSRELFTLSVLAIGVGIAYGAATLFGVSFALGAFFAGMILKGSALSHKAAQDTLPLRDAFAVLFFVSVGMLFDPRVLLEQPLAVLGTCLIIIVGKSAAAYVIVRSFRHPSDTALLIAASLAQIGEFSFMLVTLGLNLGLLPEAGRDLVLGGAILSITANPAIFTIALRMRTHRVRRATTPPVQGHDNGPQQARETDHVILVGLGRVGQRVATSLAASVTPTVVIETRVERVEAHRRSGSTAILGNATHDEVLKAAGVQQARHLLVAVPNGLEAGEIVAHARRLNPDLHIVARAHDDAEMTHIRERGADRVIMGEREIARLMIADIDALPPE